MSSPFDAAFAQAQSTYAQGYPYPMENPYGSPGMVAPDWVENDLDGWKEDLEDYTQEEDFQESFRFGLVDNGLLLAFTLAGVALDGVIERKAGVRGYGPVLGAVAGNAISDGIASASKGSKAAAGITLGALVPVVPLGIAMLLKKDLNGPTRGILLGTAAALLTYTCLARKTRKKKTS